LTARPRLTRFAVVFGCLGLTACASSGHAKGVPEAGTAAPPQAAAGPRVRGPATVTPGHIVRFRASGFRPGSNLVVILAPTDQGTCCAIRIPASFPVQSSGGRTLTFQMPTYYRHCSGSGEGSCRRVNWTRHQHASVTVSGYLEQASTVTSIGPGSARAANE
jgi:hypothetical protein